MKKIAPRMSIPADRMTAVPRSDTDHLRKAIRNQVIAPIEDRAVKRRELISKVRSRHVR